MFSLPLFKQTIKSNWVIWSAITAVMTVLCVQFSVLEMTQSLLFVIFYGMMTTILPGIYVLVVSNKLIAGQVDRGSMAYVLSTPTRRSTVVFTQAVFMVLSLTVMFGIMTAVHIAVNANNSIPIAVLLQGQQVAGDLTTQMILQVNISALMVCFGLAGVCFAFSGMFNASKYSIGLSGTFVGVNILANMLAMFGSLGVDGLDNFKYITLCTFYDYQSILLSNSDWIAKMIVPVVIAVVGFAFGSMVFCKKDLPL